MVARNKSIMTLADAPSGGSGRYPIDPNIVIVVVAVVASFFFGFAGFYFAMASNFTTIMHRELDGLESKIKVEISGMKSEIKGVSAMLESKLDGQDRKVE
jgi:hypothetical protein